MPTQPLTLNVPDPVFRQIQKQAEQSPRSVEEAALEVLAMAVRNDDALPSELAAELDFMNRLDDDALWRVAQQSLAEDVCASLESLHQQRQRGGLNEEESVTLRELVHQYERYMLTRAQAAALLRQRGHDVSKLLVE